MNDLTDAGNGGAEHEVSTEAPQVDTPSEDTAEQETGTDEPGQADETGDAPKRKPWWEKRFDELTAKRYDAEREAAYWRGIAEATKQPEPAVARQEGPPREDQFESFEDFEQARIDYAVEQRLRQAEAAKAQQAVLQTYEERAARLKEAKPDYDSVVNNPALRITPMMADVIRESDVGPEVAYHLGTNPQEAARIASLPHHRQAVELGKLEVKLSAPAQAPKAPNRNPPPPPPQPVAGLSAGLTKDPNDMTMAEYAAARKAGLI